MDYIIETQFEGPGFVAVPNAVAQMDGLSAECLGVVVWLASLPKGFAVRRSTILERFGFGKDKWQRIARELASFGALCVVNDRGQGGRFSRRYVVRWPEAQEAVQPGPGFPAPVEPAPVNPPQNGGKPAKRGRKIRPSIQKEIINTARGKREQGVQPVQRRRPPHESGGGAGGPDVSKLPEFVRTQIRLERAVVLAGELVKPGTVAFQRLAAALAATPENAMKGVVR